MDKKKCEKGNVHNYTPSENVKVSFLPRIWYECFLAFETKFEKEIKQMCLGCY